MGYFTVGLDGVLGGRAERKRTRLRGRLVNVCPHIHIVNLDFNDGVEAHYQPLFETFFGTTMYRCQGCSLQQSEFGGKPDT